MLSFEKCLGVDPSRAPLFAEPRSRPAETIAPALLRLLDRFSVYIAVAAALVASIRIPAIYPV